MLTKFTISYYHKTQRISFHCLDIDECELYPHFCGDVNAKCVDTYGSFLCECNEGFEGDGTTCKSMLYIC